ncbi:MAG: tetratricopeptide repeat protein [Candidatus Rokubacteria bacterium]|nr:tetratricopeptide repeat protein [Candidatus Rokubacteria bacterium]
MRDNGRQRRGAALGAALLAVVASGAGAGVWHARSEPLRPGAAAATGHVDDRACAECHRSEYERWATSHHARAMQPADDMTVLGDFTGAVFKDRGITARFFRRGPRFFVNTEGPGGKPADFEITYTFGVEPLQQYLVPFPGGRLQALTIAWDTQRKRWFSLYPDVRFRLDDPRHWTGRYENWNLMCAECHTTSFRKGYDAESDSYRSAWDALNVGCQACHGPGAAHVASARARAAGAGPPPDGTGLAVDLASRDARGQVDACAACHARRTRLSETPRPGAPFLDGFVPQRLHAGLYHPDGQQLGEVFEYGSFLQSTMYRRGVRCTDCHDPHAGTLRARGNALCAGCHGPRPDPRFPTLKAAVYDSPAHHFHPAGSPGAACVACHMPARNYMIVHARRDHALGVPRPDVSAELGTPNACTGCHAGRPARWATRAIRRWYGSGAARDTRTAETIAAGRAGARVAEPRLWALAADVRQPGILRATALDLLRARPGAGVGALQRALADADPLVRLAAVGALDRLPVEQRIALAAPLLTDPLRAVRIDAARVLAVVPAERLAASVRGELAAALADLSASHAAMVDMPSTHVVLGQLYESRGQRDLAGPSYETALRMDPYLVSARTHLARLHDAAGRVSAAESVLREGLRRAPDSGELRYSLGLVLAEQQRFVDAAEELGKAVRLMPRDARVRYNQGLALQRLGRRPAAAALLEAYRLDPADPQIVHAVAAWYLAHGDHAHAELYAKRLADLVPGDAAARDFLDRVRRGPARNRAR